MDGTDPPAEERAGLLALGAPARAAFPDVPLDVCPARDDAREERARVPLVGLYASAERLVAPTVAEGFVEVVRYAG